MATFVSYFQKQDGSALVVNSNDHIWQTGTTWGTPVIVGSYQDGTHLSDANDLQRDQAVSGNNLKFLTSSTVAINGGGSVALNTVTSGSAPLRVNFSHSSSVATTGATFFAYDGVTQANALPGITFQAAEVSPNFAGQATNSSWTAANGSGSALSLVNQASLTSHDFYIALSASPSKATPLVGSVCLTLTYA